MASGPITSWEIDGQTVKTVTDFISFHYFSFIIFNILFNNKITCNYKAYHARIWESDHKTSWVLKNWWFWTVVLKKTLESPLNCKEIQSVNPKGNQSCIFIGRTEAEAETPTLWPADGKNWLIWKDPDAGKDWRQDEKGTTEDEVVGWHHWLNGRKFE